MEPTGLQSQTFRIDGMTCVNCRNRIEKALRNTAGVHDASVSYETGTATVTYDPSALAFSALAAVIENLGYKVAGTVDPSVNNKTFANTGVRIAGILVAIIALYILLRAFSISGLAAAFPTAKAGMGYGMVLVIGLLTSVHCIAMCGGINLSQTMKKGSGEWGVGSGGRPSDYNLASGLTPDASNNTLHSLLPSILYNSGRILSYTAVGVIVGALGSVLTVSGRFQGAILLLAGVFMLIMGINMLGWFPGLQRFVPRLPKVFAKKIDEQKVGKGPLLVGFLNGFIPCGPLQAMQLYALSTGSPLRGGISMFLFCLGTIPLMFALGAAGTLLSGVRGQTFSRRVMQVGAALVAAMGLAMLSNGMNLAGFGISLDRAMASGTAAPQVRDGVQLVNSTLLPNRYPAIVVEQGVPVRWVINAPPGSINGCNNRMIVREYGIEHSFRPGDNVIEFVPAKTGRFAYSCWMGMIRSSITVVAEGESVTGFEFDTLPKPAGVDIPTEKIAIAQAAGNYQMVEIILNDDGFEPAIVVMQRGLPALWNINIASFNLGSSSLVFPAYYAVLNMEPGDNPMRMMPTDDFDFSTVDNAFYGYVKVVDDINSIDVNAIKEEVANHKTLIYPDSYFESAGGG